MSDLTEFSKFCKEDKSVDEFTKWIETNGIDHKMISVCYEKPLFVKVLLDKGISLHEDVTWTCGILNVPRSVEFICKMRRESMQSIAEHHGLVSKCKNPTTLDILLELGVNVDTKFQRPGMTGVDKEPPSYYVTDVDLMHVFVKHGATRFNMEYIVNDPVMLKYFIGVPGEQIRSLIIGAIPLCRYTQCIELLFTEKYEVPEKQLFLITNQDVIDKLPEKIRDRHPLSVEKEKRRRAYYDAVNERKFDELKDISSKYPEADIEYYNKDTKFTVIGLAVESRNLDAVKWLLENKADADAKPFMKNHGSEKGRTPLIMAVEKTDTQIVHLLLTHKADPLYRMKSGRDVVSYLTSDSYNAVIIDLVKSAYMTALTNSK